ncbi:hypothetical protein CsatB_018485 [Cannabis sativa]
MDVTRSSSSPSPVQKKNQNGFEITSYKAKGKRPFIEEEDSNFAPPLTKRGRAPPKKKTKVGVQEKMAEDVYGKNNNVGAAVRTEVCFRFETIAVFSPSWFALYS